jgi:hypothetical protein
VGLRVLKPPVKVVGRPIPVIVDLPELEILSRLVRQPMPAVVRHGR